MDNNTKDVLMALIPAVVVPIVGAIIVLINRTHLKKVETKVDEYHKEINGRMGQLLETTKQLATEKERAREKGEDKKEPGL